MQRSISSQAASGLNRVASVAKPRRSNSFTLQSFFFLLGPLFWSRMCTNLCCKETLFTVCLCVLQTKVHGVHGATLPSTHRTSQPRTVDASFVCEAAPHSHTMSGVCTGARSCLVQAMTLSTLCNHNMLQMDTRASQASPLLTLPFMLPLTFDMSFNPGPVSYTHLTLPTIHLV